MNPFVSDLLWAKLIGKAVDVEMLNGQRYFAGVNDVNEAENWFALWNPQTFADTTTFRRLPIDLILSVTVTDVDYGEAAA